MTFAASWLAEVQAIAGAVEPSSIERLAESLHRVRGNGGRVFVLGLGGSAANASHCVNDLRVRGGVEAYAPTDNVAELTARVNDEIDGWVNCLARWLEGSRLAEKDAVLILSGSGESLPLLMAARYAQQEHRAGVYAILGRQASSIGRYCRVAVVIPEGAGGYRPGHAEAFQAVVWHAVVEAMRA